MIDIESEVFNAVYAAVTDEVSNVNMSSEYVYAPPSFPHITLWEMDNATDTYHASSKTPEEFANVTYEVHVYSNKESGRKRECRELMDIVDRAMLNLGFMRYSMQSVQNYNDTRIYQIVARYRATVDHNKVIYYRR